MSITRDEYIIRTARKYEIRPGTLKCVVFALLDKHYNSAEIKFKLRNHPKAHRNKTFGNTIRRYEKLWKSLQKP